MTELTDDTYERLSRVLAPAIRRWWEDHPDDDDQDDDDGEGAS